MGTSPMGLILLATLAKGATVGQPDGPTGPSSPAEASVPDVTVAGDDLAAAGGILKASGLTAGRTRPVVSDEPKDIILGSTPEAGTLVPLGTVVAVLVSAGLVVPNVAGMLRADAEAALATAGFGSTVEMMDVPGTPDAVKKQDPAAGDLASYGDAVTLFVVESPPRKSGRASVVAAEEEPITSQPS